MKTRHKVGNPAKERMLKTKQVFNILSQHNTSAKIKPFPIFFHHKEATKAKDVEDKTRI